MPTRRGGITCATSTRSVRRLHFALLFLYPRDNTCILQRIMPWKGMYDADLDGTIPPDLEIANYGFVDADMDKEIKLGNLLQSGFLANDRGPVKLRDIVKRLRQA